MKRKLLIICMLLVAGGVVLRAQDRPVIKLDEPVIESTSPLMTAPDFLSPIFPSTLSLPHLEFETEEQRAARINLMIYHRVTASVNQNLMGFKPPRLTTGQRLLYFGLGLFLSNPNKFPDGCVPLMNASNPFIFAKTPGLAPYPSPYSAEDFAQCIRTEYDFASGTYKQVMVDWGTFQNSRVFYYEPVPRVNLNPGDRIVNGTAP